MEPLNKEVNDLIANMETKDALMVTQEIERVVNEHSSNWFYKGIICGVILAIFIAGIISMIGLLF